MTNVLDDTSELLNALERGVSLPSSWYTDNAILEKEIDLIFRRSWQYVGSVHELRNTGDYVTAYVGNVPVVALRNDTGISAFVNVCRHRRHEVMKGCGNSTFMQCRYHAWTYDLNGCLKAAPRADREADFKVEDYPLLSLRTETLGPFVFVNFDEGDKHIESYFGDVLPIIASSGIDLNNLELFERSPWESNSNWKTMLENYLECYHCPVAHPGFSAAIDVDPDSYKLTSHNWFFSQIGKVRESGSKTKSKVKTYDTRGEIEQSQYHVLFPNFTININPGFPNLSVDVWNPNGPNRAQGFSTQFFAPGVDKEWAEELVHFNHQVGHEDDELTDSVQRGLLGGFPDRGRFLTNSEHLIVEFQKLIVKALASDRVSAKGLIVALLMVVVQTLSSSTSGMAQSATNSVKGFQADELPKRIGEKPKYRDVADRVLLDWSNKKYPLALEDAQSLAQSAKPKRAEIDQLTSTAESKLSSGDRDKAGALHVIAYQALKSGGRATTDDTIARLSKIVSILTSAKTTEADRIFATGLVDQALQTRKLGGGLLDSDAPLVLLHARLEFSLKHWETAEKEYIYWIGIYESKGKSPPANDLPDALGELGIAYTSQKNIPKAEEYFVRACDVTLKLNGTTVTPINQYDVEDFLIFNLLTQGKLDMAKERAQEHLKFKERTLGLRSPKLADELNRYADLFEQAGETAFSFSLRTRAGRVVSP